MVNSLLDVSENGAVSKYNKFLRVLPTPKFHNRLALYNLNFICCLVFVVKSQTTFLCDHGPGLFEFSGQKNKNIYLGKHSCPVIPPTQARPDLQSLRPPTDPTG